MYKNHLGADTGYYRLNDPVTAKEGRKPSPAVGFRLFKCQKMGVQIPESKFIP